MTYIDRVWLKNQLAKILQIIMANFKIEQKSIVRLKIIFSYNLIVNIEAYYNISLT